MKPGKRSTGLLKLKERLENIDENDYLDNLEEEICDDAEITVKID